MNYCKAYKIGDLRRYAQWTAGTKDQAGALEDDAIVYIQDNYVVTSNPLDADNADDFVFVSEDDAWRTFCAEELKFSIPSEVELSVG